MGDTLASRRRFRILIVGDEFTREWFTPAVDTSLRHLRVIRELDPVAELGYIFY